MNIKHITSIGAGNVAFSLITELQKNGYIINQVFSRNINNALELAAKCKSEATDNLNKINRDSDLYIISVKDDAISSVLKELEIKNKLIVHTAGSISIDVFDKHSEYYGVFYPLQTFSKGKLLNFSKIPICIEGANQEITNTLKTVASTLSTRVHEIDSKQRGTLHLAAVFACNFANHFFAIAHDILENNNIDFDIIKPLLKETVTKALRNNPKDVQTGPAVRNDEKTIKNHLDKLNRFPEFQKLYSFVSDSIKDFHK